MDNPIVLRWRPAALAINFLRLVGWLPFTLIVVARCSQEPVNTGPQYRAMPTRNILVYHFAVHPRCNPTKLFQASQPLIDYLNKNLDKTHLLLEASRY